jgi:hypothetical protein
VSLSLSGEVDRTRFPQVPSSPRCASLFEVILGAFSTVRLATSINLDSGVAQAINFDSGVSLATSSSSIEICALE